MTNQSVEAAPGRAGIRWYEIRRTDGAYSVYQQGTYAPADGVHRKDGLTTRPTSWYVPCGGLTSCHDGGTELGC